MLEDFLIKADPAINIVMWQDAIERQIKNAEKYPLLEIESVPVTQKELDACTGLTAAAGRKRFSGPKAGVGKQSVMGRLLFTMICLAKFGNIVNEQNDSWVNRQENEVFRLANIDTNSKRRALMYSDLRDIGLIRFSKKVDNINVRVTCVDPDGEPVLAVTDFRNLGNQFRMYCGEPYFECASCGLVVKRKNNSQLYCEDCGVIMNRKKTLDNYRSRMTLNAS